MNQIGDPILFPDLPTSQKEELDRALFKAKLQGQEANIAGKLCEQAIEAAFKLRDIPVRSYNGRAAADFFDKRILFRNAPFTSLYHSLSKSEFLYVHNELRVRIECRVQTVPGSVDEKFPYLMRNAEQHMPEQHIWLIIEGVGARAKAMDWIRGEAKRIMTKHIRIMNLSEGQKAVKHLVEQGKA